MSGTTVRFMMVGDQSIYRWRTPAHAEEALRNWLHQRLRDREIGKEKAWRGNIGTVSFEARQDAAFRTHGPRIVLHSICNVTLTTTNGDLSHRAELPPG